jgi:hypothetical protein
MRGDSPRLLTPLKSIRDVLGWMPLNSLSNPRSVFCPCLINAKQISRVA